MGYDTRTCYRIKCQHAGTCSSAVQQGIDCAFDDKKEFAVQRSPVDLFGKAVTQTFSLFPAIRSIQTEVCATVAQINNVTQRRRDHKV
jgi:hypothetical protein